MNFGIKSILASGLVCAGLGLSASSAQALPLTPDPLIATDADATLRAENVRWVCGPYRCRWVPNRNYGPQRFYGRPVVRYGWRGNGWRGDGWRGDGWRGGYGGRRDFY